MDTALFIKALGGFFAIMNPFVALPMFLSLTHGYSPADQRAAGLRVAAFCLLLAVVIMATGTMILEFFGISVDDFRVAGGIVMLMIALGMLNGTGSTAHSGTPGEQARQATRDDITFYPMTFPMIVGPGTITTIIVFMGQAKDMPGKIAVSAALAVVLVLMALVLWFAGSIGHRMSQTLRTVMTRLMGVILAAIAVGMIAAGVKVLLPGLAG